MRTRSASPNFNDVKYNVNCDVNCVMSCVSLSDVRSTSRVSVCSVPSFIIVQVGVIEVGSPFRGSSSCQGHAHFCSLSESNAQRSLQSCNPSPIQIPSCSSRNPSLGCQSIVGLLNVFVFVIVNVNVNVIHSLLGESALENAIDCRHSLLWPSLLLLSVKLLGLLVVFEFPAEKSSSFSITVEGP